MKLKARHRGRQFCVPVVRGRLHPLLAATQLHRHGGGFCLTLCLFASTAAALEPPVVAVDVTALGDGDYVLRKSGGAVTIRPLVLLTPSGPTPLPPAPTPTPAPRPDNPVLTDRAKAYTALAKQITAPDGGEYAIAIAALYRQMAQAAKEGAIRDQATLVAATKAATDLVLARTTNGAAWGPVRARLSDDWAQLARSGAAYSAYADLLHDAANGVEAAIATRENRAIDPEMLRLILEVVKIILCGCAAGAS